MEYLVTAEEMKRCDQTTIEKFGVPSMVLMERAALACTEELTDGSFDLKNVLVVCGSGNNGGDGFAIARLLHLRGIAVSVYFAGKEASCTQETRLQKNICEKYGVIFVSKLGVGEYTSIVDAMFGVGLSRNIEGSYAEVIGYMNQSKAAILAVDIASGVSADTGKVMGTAVRADKTVTFAFKKIGHVLYPGTEYAGSVSVKDIGITVDGFENQLPKAISYTKRDLQLLPPRFAYSNKGTYGKVLVVAGSLNMCGAAFLSAKAAYKTGAGLVQIFTEESNRIMLQTMLPEAILTTYDTCDFRHEQLEEAAEQADVIVFGPGIGKKADKRKMLELLVKLRDKPLLIDADGLNLLADNPQSLDERKRPAVVTPHVGEMSRLCHAEKKDVLDNLFQTACTYASVHGVICVLKDARTIVTDGQEIYVNQSGNSGMAVGGSGDVLTGIIAGLMAQKMPETQAARLGVYLHGLAGDAARDKCGSYAMLATDIIKGLQEILIRGEKEHAEI